MRASPCRRRAAVTLARIAARTDMNSGNAASASKIVQALRVRQITVEHDICGCGKSALDQIHQQKGEIVEHVAGRDTVVEFDGVEQHRLAVNQDDVAEMQVAMAAANKTGALARIQQ